VIKIKVKVRARRSQRVRRIQKLPLLSQSLKARSRHQPKDRRRNSMSKSVKSSRRNGTSKIKFIRHT